MAACAVPAVSPLQESGAWWLLAWREGPGCWGWGAGGEDRPLRAAGVRGGAGAALSPVCGCRTWMTASSPNGTRSWSWTRSGGRGGSKAGGGGPAQGRALGGVTWQGEGHGMLAPSQELGWEPDALPVEGGLWHCFHTAALARDGGGGAPGGSRAAGGCHSLAPPLPGGTSSGSGSRGSSSGCSSACTSARGSPSRSPKLPHSSLSQTTVRGGRGGGGCGGRCLRRGVRAGRVRNALVLSAVESLLITPYLPVVAFGRPLPKLAPQ